MQIVWLHVRADASRTKWLNSIGQQIMHYTDIFPDSSIWKLLNSMNSIRATSISLFKNRLDRQNTLNYIHITIASVWFFDFFKVQNSLKVHETSHTNFILFSFLSWGWKKEVKNSPPRNTIHFPTRIRLHWNKHILWNESHSKEFPGGDNSHTRQLLLVLTIASIFDLYCYGIISILVL